MKALGEVRLNHNGTALLGELAIPNGPGPHPAVLVFPSAVGLSDEMRRVASRLGDEGYLAVAVDIYGDGAYSVDQDTIATFVGPLWGTPMLRSRVVAWFELLRSRGDVLPGRIAAIGYCFGGQCVLELARSGADIKAAVSYHGILTTFERAMPGAIKGQVAVYTGGKDPHAPPEHVNALRDELIVAGAMPIALRPAALTMRWRLRSPGPARWRYSAPRCIGASFCHPAGQVPRSASEAIGGARNNPQEKT